MQLQSFETNGKIASMTHHRAPRMDRATIDGAVHSVTDCRGLRNLPAAI